MPIGSREYFNEVEARKYFVEPHIPAFANFSAWRDKKVLEIGCGIGTDTINFARAGASVTAVELSESSLALAKKRAEVFGLHDKIRFVSANAELLSQNLAPEPFDLIYSFGVIHHSPSPEKILREIRDHFVHSETHLKLMVYNRRSFKVLEMILRNLGTDAKPNELVPKFSEAQANCPITFSYSRAEVKQLLESSGFSIHSATIDHIFPYEIEAYTNYRYVKRPLFRFTPNFLFKNLEKIWGWHWLIEAMPSKRITNPR